MENVGGLPQAGPSGKLHLCKVIHETSAGQTLQTLSFEWQTLAVSLCKDRARTAQ